MSKEIKRFGVHYLREGIGDFIVKLPAIEYYINQGYNMELYVTPKFEPLARQVKDAKIIVSCEIQSQLFNIESYHQAVNERRCAGQLSHETAVWLPKIPEFHGNYTMSEPFIYPKIDTDCLLTTKIEQILNIRKPFLCYTKIAADPERNWKEDGWQALLNNLQSKYCLVHVGLPQSDKNSIPYYTYPGVIEAGHLNLFEIACLISHADAFISTDTGMFHLATAVGHKKTIVLVKGYTYWTYPNTICINIQQSMEKIIDTILQKLNL